MKVTKPRKQEQSGREKQRLNEQINETQEKNN